MQYSSLPIRTWIIAIIFIAVSKKEFSGGEPQRQLGMKHIEPVFRMYHKLCVVMGQQDESYRLVEIVEYDEAFFGKATKDKVGSNLKRERGNQKHSKAAVMAESTPLENPELGKAAKSFKSFKRKTIKNLMAKKKCSI